MGDHFYTIDAAERDRALAEGYHWERVQCYVAINQQAEFTPLYRLFNHDTGNHFYTISAAERDHAIAADGYSDEGTSCYVASTQSADNEPLYRLFNGDANDHFYTTSEAERESAIRNSGYRDEGVACFVYAAPALPADSPLYRLYKPGESWYDKVGDFFSSILDGLSAGLGLLLGGFFGLLGLLLDGIGLGLSFVFQIPWLGPLLHDAWNIILTAFWGILSIFDFLLTLIGIRPEKKLRLCIIIQRNADGDPVAEIGSVLGLLQTAIDVFKTQANVRVIPVSVFDFSNAFQSTPTASEDHIYTEDYSSTDDTLIGSCNTGGFVNDVTTAGPAFTQKMYRECFFGDGRRIIGYGAPVTAFAVERFSNGTTTGCSVLGPVTDYVMVVFSPGTALRTLAHEMGHTCNLWHVSDPDSLMTPEEDGGVGMSLDSWQIGLVRASRHVTYF